MGWETSYVPDLDAVLSVYAGAISPGEFREAVLSATSLARQKGTLKYLTDCSGLAGGPSIVDLYNMAKMLEAAGCDPGSCEALVLPQLSAPASEIRFWETTCRNRGYAVQVFDTLAQATAWLSER